MKQKHNLKITTLITIGLWIPVIALGISIVDNGFLCNQIYDDDEFNNLTRCLDGESQFAFVVLAIIFAGFSLMATQRVCVMYLENKEWQEEEKYKW